MEHDNTNPQDDKKPTMTWNGQPLNAEFRGFALVTDRHTPQGEQVRLKVINDYTLNLDGVTYDMTLETWHRLANCDPSGIDALFKSLVASGAIWRVTGGDE